MATPRWLVVGGWSGRAPCSQVTVALLLILLFGSTLAHDCYIVTIYALKNAQCGNKNLKAIPNDMDPDITVLDFADNQLAYLGLDEFASYRALQDIRLKRNHIERIAPDAFRGLTNLQFVDLEGNKLKSLPIGMFAHMGTVRELVMKSNPLQILPRNAFSGLQRIEKLNFENCWLQRVHPHAFAGLPQLEEINLVNNELQTLDSDMGRHLPAALRVLRIYSNPWVCDCNLRWLRDLVDRKDFSWDFLQNIPTCDYPKLIHGVNWRTLAPEQFACAAQIVSNSTTSIRLELNANITIECVVHGDPDPDIRWKKGERSISPSKITQTHYFSPDGSKEIRSAMVLKDIEPEDAGDYRCIAKNIGGRSEVIYKLWIQDPGRTDTVVTLFGITTETLIGIGIGAGVLVVALFIGAYCFVQRKEGRRNGNSPNVLDYAKTVNQNHAPIPKRCTVPEEALPVLTEVPEKVKTSSLTVTSKLLTIDEKPEPDVQITTTTCNDINETKITVIDSSPKGATARAASPKPRELKEACVKTNGCKAAVDSKAKSNEFKMKIFKVDGSEKEQEGASGPSSKDCGSKSPTPSVNIRDDSVRTEPRQQQTTPIMDRTVPDVIQRSDNKTPNHTPSVVPNINTPLDSHVSQSRRRAEENPYAKRSDMLAAANKRKSDSRQDIDCAKFESQRSPRTTRVTISLPNESDIKIISDSDRSPSPKKTVSLVDPKRCVTLKEHASTCKNPVCLKEHHGDSTRVKSPTKADVCLPGQESPGRLSPDKSHIKESRSMGGLSQLPDHTRAPKGGSPSPPTGPQRAAASAQSQDRYRTLPSRPKSDTPSLDSQHYVTFSKARKLPSVQEQTPPTVRFQTLPHPSSSSASSSSAGASASTLRPMKTATITSHRQLPQILKSPPHEPQIHGFSPCLPPDPLPPYLKGGASGGGGGAGRESTLSRKPGSRTSTGSHGDPVTKTSPVKRPLKAFESTSLDDLLSPPFSHIQVDRPKSPRATTPQQLPKPGDKDEYGTAV